MRRTLAMMLAFGGLLPAHAADEPPPALITTVALRFIPGDNALPLGPITVQRGQRLTYFNADNLGVHSIYSMDFDEQGAPLFWADQQNLGSVADVEGVADLPPGRYGFLCSNHPEMTGTLVITDDNQGAV